VKIKIKKIETFTITHSTEDFVFDLNEFRTCTPAFIGKTHKDFMDYLTNDIDDMAKFLYENKDLICQSTQKSLYLLEIEPKYTVIEDSRESYEDSWYTMEKQIEGKVVPSEKKSV
jgi:hypothetical protein